MAEFNAMDTAAFKGVWVFCEQREGQVQAISYQLLSEGRKLANDLGVELCGVVMGSEVNEDYLKALGGYGADRVYYIDSPLLKDYTTDGYAKALCDLIMEKKPEIMLIGEAPGKDEVTQKKPFVGRAGKNLAEFLGASGLKREDLYVTNVCKFRPTKISAKNTVSNRPPTKEEILAARPFLHEEIRLVSPRLLVTLGNTPLHAVWDFSVNIGGCHGAAEKIMLEKNGYWLFPLYHPASIIYNPALKETYMCDISNLTVWVNKNL